MHRIIHICIYGWGRGASEEDMQIGAPNDLWVTCELAMIRRAHSRSDANVCLIFGFSCVCGAVVYLVHAM